MLQCPSHQEEREDFGANIRFRWIPQARYQSNSLKNPPVKIESEGIPNRIEPAKPRGKQHGAKNVQPQMPIDWPRKTILSCCSFSILIRPIHPHDSLILQIVPGGDNRNRKQGKERM